MFLAKVPKLWGSIQASDVLKGIGHTSSQPVKILPIFSRGHSKRWFHFWVLKTPAISIANHGRSPFSHSKVLKVLNLCRDRSTKCRGTGNNIHFWSHYTGNPFTFCCLGEGLCPIPLTNRLSIQKRSPPFSKSKNLQSLNKYDVCDGPERFAERVFWSSAFAAEQHVRTQISLIFFKNTHLVAVQRGNYNFVIIRKMTFFENIVQCICYNLCYYICYCVCYNHMLIFMLLFS